MKKCLTFLILLGNFALAYGQSIDSAAVVQKVDSLLGICRILIDDLEFQKAFAIGNVAVGIAQENLGETSFAYGTSCFSIGRVLHRNGKYTEAENWYLRSERALEISVGAEHPDFVRTLNNLGFLYWHMAKYEMAEPLLLESKIIRQKLFGNEGEEYAESLHNLAILYYFMGDYEKCEPLYLESMTLRERLLGKDHPDYAWSLNNLANLYMDLGKYEQSEQLHLKAKAIWKKTVGENHPDYAEALNNLGYLYWKMGQYKEAEKLYLQAKSIRLETLGQNHPSYGASLHNLSNLYWELDAFDKAEKLCLETLAIKERTTGKEHHSYASSIHSLGLLNYKMGNFGKAERCYLEAIQIRLRVLGIKHPEYLQSLSALSHLYVASAQFEKAAPLFEELTRLDRTLLQRAVHHLSEKELKGYLQFFLANQDALFSFAHLSTDNQSGVARLSFDNTLFYKGFLLNSAKQIERLASNNVDAEQMLSQLKSLNRQLAEQYASPLTSRNGVVELENQADALGKKLARTVAGYGEATEQVTWQQIQSRLAPYEAAIEFVHFSWKNPEPTDSILYAALLLRRGWEAPRWVTLFEEKQIMALLEKTDSRQAGYANQLLDNQSLYELIWQPLEKHLDGVRHINFSPTGILHRIPLAAIETGEGQTFGDRFSLRQLGSTRQLVVGGQKLVVGSNNEAVIFGGVKYDMDSTAIASANDLLALRSESDFSGTSRSMVQGGKPWKYLPWTEVEAKTLHAIFQKNSMASQLHLSHAATEEIFRKTGRFGKPPRVLHVATHGYFFSADGEQRTVDGEQPIFKISEHPMIRSGLILAGANHAWTGGEPLENLQDGILTAYEVSQMDLRGTELVVLSACETGLGDIDANEGVFGLQRAFKIAGAKYLLMSLWQVPDFVTQELMTAFYKNWLEKEMTIPEAFHAAQNQVEAERPEAFFWAGFVLVE